MGSASQPMLVVKANRALLQKRKSFKEIRASYIGKIKEVKLEFKQLTPLEQKKIRDKIRAQAKKDQLHTIKMRLLAAFVLLIGFLALYQFFIG